MVHPSIYFTAVLTIFFFIGIIIEKIDPPDLTQKFLLILVLLSLILLLVLFVHVAKYKIRGINRMTTNETRISNNENTIVAPPIASILSVSDLIARMNSSSDMNVEEIPDYRQALFRSMAVRFKVTPNLNDGKSLPPPGYLTFVRPDSINAPPSYRKC